MDSAVESDPTKATVRFIRAVNNFNLPAFVNRRDNARADFEILLKNLEGNPEQLSPTTQQAIYYFAGVAYVQLGRKKEGKETLLKGQALRAEPTLDAKIKAELAKLTKY
ncbi:MAG: hypothetical protein HC904_12205 [Blastochloris sp.]|nr:hypothetical protein [Blastochloris sp.]